MPKPLGQRRVDALIDKAFIAKAGHGQDAAYLSPGIAEEEASAAARHRATCFEDRRNPAGVDEVALLETDKDFDVRRDCGVKPLSEPVGDREVQLPLHS